MNKETQDLIVSWLTISVAFAWIGTAIFSTSGFAEFIQQLMIMLVAVGTGFILHELAHKYVGIYYGAKAEFRAWNQGLLLAIGLAIISNGMFVFAAPGAVYVQGNNITREQNGHISIAGPLANLTIALFFGLLFGLLKPQGLLLNIIGATIFVNFFLAFFNMIPIFPLDGSKVFMWNKTAWVATILFAASGVFFFQYYLAIFSLI